MSVRTYYYYYYYYYYCLSRGSIQFFSLFFQTEHRQPDPNRTGNRVISCLAYGMRLSLLIIVAALHSRLVGHLGVLLPVAAGGGRHCRRGCRRLRLLLRLLHPQGAARSRQCRGARSGAHEAA